MHRPELSTEDDRPYTIQTDPPLRNLDQLSERKRQRSPEDSLPCSPPHSPVQDRKAMVQDADLEMSRKDEKMSIEITMMQDSKQSEFSPKVSGLEEQQVLNNCVKLKTY